MIDSDLTLGVRSQAEVAELVGVHPSTVSRHFRRHVQQRIAMTVATGTSEIAIGNLAAEHEWLYGISREVLMRAVEDDDRKLTRDMIGECRRQLVEMRELKKTIEAGKIGDAGGQSSLAFETELAADIKEMNDLAEDYRLTMEILEIVKTALREADSG